MCLALPAKVTALLPDQKAIVDLGGIFKEISLLLCPEAKIGDYVVIHVGYALSLLDATAAKQTLELIAQITTVDKE
ncbi:MAG: HypC/HybG/HupF family hydrogenase formation chaperone [Coxiellaceae bacterium]|nr:MAG: HypC/HybG/HupF family hydrogenase formation chaperone [Coxiellaceae bacterium]